MNQQLISPTKKKNRKSVHSKSGRTTAKTLHPNAQALIRKVETTTKNTSRQSSKPKPAQVYLPKHPKSAHKLRSKSNSPNRGKELRPKRLKSSKLKPTFECKASRKLQRQLLRQKKMDVYLKSKADNGSNKVADVQSYFQSTRSYYPLSHEREEILDRQSYTVSQANFQDESLFKSEYEEEPDAPVMTQFHPKANPVYPQSKIISQLPEKEHFSKAEWEAFQSLKLKNEELSNYIEQLEKVEQKMTHQAKAREQAIRSEYTSEKDQMMKEIGKLKEDQNKLCLLNASLLQMFNESKQNFDALTIRCNQLNTSVELGKSRELKLEQQKTSAIQKATLLESQLRTHESKMNKLQQQRQFWQQKISSCNRQKEQIKMNAHQMLKMLQKLQQSQDM